VASDADPIEDARRWGLCASCVHHLVITNDRGSRFVQCARSRIDPVFPRYPRLPVEVCNGHLSLLTTDSSDGGSGKKPAG
jgi:hypothetical protein